MSASRRCTKCGLVKSTSDFCKRKDSTSGFTSQCKACESERKRARYNSLFSPGVTERIKESWEFDIDVDPGEPVEPVGDAKFKRLVKLASAKNATVTTVCDGLGVSPKMLAQLVEEAKLAGFAVRVSGGEVGIAASEPSGSVVDVAQPEGEWQRIASISDTHFGSLFTFRPNCLILLAAPTMSSGYAR